ncbi:sulfotransferase [Nostoc sp. NMS8]|uniref:sulfotransferase n=1 Tax=Nostoc sp. NMS8 TaxID=2815392 RepID=UPI0025E2377E|nr:sulfotransferase [Nostoc sp. NMS8]MBN3960044.1 sulfotransferase [Nostoc sp. NMS8]
MRVVALLTVRNEERFLPRCLEHLYSQGIETCLIDNGSYDKTLEIARTFLNKGVFKIEHLPYPGYFELSTIISNEEKLAKEIDTDWFIHHDADEIRQAPKPYRTLIEGIEDADRQGYNAINFDEFVFMPTSDDESFEGKNYVEEMHYYYFYEPDKLYRLNAWKNLNIPINLTNAGGHRVAFEGQRIFPVSFILRHYVVLSRTHALQKYLGRVHSMKETIERGWHRVSSSFTSEHLNFPSRERLKLVSADNSWDKSEPWLYQEFKGNRPFLTNQITACEKPNQEENSKQELLKETSCPPMPIIVSVGNSGATLLRLMLDAHPELSILAETHFMLSVLQLKSEGDVLRHELYNLVVNSPSWGGFHLSKEDFYNKLGAINPFNLSDGLRCFYKIYVQQFKKPRYGDKTPQYLTQMSSIQAALPEAHFIHIIRDGRDVALSKRGLGVEPGNDIEAQASNWVWQIREARQQAQFCPHYLEIHYEDLITDTKSVLMKICQFIDLLYSENLLTQFLPDRTRINNWQREMSISDRAKFEAIAGSMLHELGYKI